ncbi:MAG: CAAX prenyl protease-related protein [Gemmatimonadaceae bacterium]|nr:CAAX prenyl protease-related protein [Gemmatimonadaceae bacterium]
MTPLTEKYPVLPWVGPFAVFMALLALSPSLAIPQPWESILRVSILVGVLWYFSGHLIRTFRIEHALGSVALGVAVCAMWVAPDLLVPGWRSHGLVQNSITGTITNSIAPADLADPLVVTLRIVRAALLVPILEELFWRGWLPRWIVNPDWKTVPLGKYTTLAFVASSALFAAEHGPYWEVGLLCGFIYNWWFWKTKSLGDIVLVHAVTNAALSAFVFATGKYEYWM